MRQFKMYENLVAFDSPASGGDFYVAGVACYALGKPKFDNFVR